MDHQQIRSAALELRAQTDLAKDIGLRRRIVDRAFRYFGPEEE